MKADSFLTIAQVLAPPSKEKKVKIPVFRRMTSEQLNKLIGPKTPAKAPPKHADHLKVS